MLFRISVSVSQWRVLIFNVAIVSNKDLNVWRSNPCEQKLRFPMSYFFLLWLKYDIILCQISLHGLLLQALLQQLFTLHSLRCYVELHVASFPSISDYIAAGTHPVVLRRFYWWFFIVKSYSPSQSFIGSSDGGEMPRYEIPRLDYFRSRP